MAFKQPFRQYSAIFPQNHRYIYVSLLRNHCTVYTYIVQVLLQSLELALRPPPRLLMAKLLPATRKTNSVGERVRDSYYGCVNCRVLQGWAKFNITAKKRELLYLYLLCAKNTKQQEKGTDLGSFSQASKHCRPEVKGSISRVIKYAYLQKEKTTSTVVGVLNEPYAAKPAQRSSHTGQPGYIGWTLGFQPL